MRSFFFSILLKLLEKVLIQAKNGFAVFQKLLTELKHLLLFSLNGFFRFPFNQIVYLALLLV